MTRKSLRFCRSLPFSLALLACLTATSRAVDQTYHDANATNTWNTGDFNWDLGAAQWTDNNTAIFAGTGESVAVGTVTANGITFNSLGYTLTGGTISLGAASTTITTNQNAIIQSVLGGGANALVKEGTGSLSLGSASATYSGGTTVNNGVLIISGLNNGNSTVGPGTLTINAGGIVRATSHNTLGQGTGAHLSPLVINGGTFEADQYNHINSITMTGGTLGVRSGVTQVDGMDMKVRSAVNPTITTLASANTATISSRLLIGVPTLFTVADGGAATDLNVTGLIQGGSNLTKSGPGLMAMTNANTYSGTTSVNGGRLVVSGNNGLLNSSSFTASGGSTLEFGAVNIFVAGHGTAVANSRVITADASTLLFNTNFDARIGNVTLTNAATWTSNRGFAAWDALLANTTTGAATVSVTGTGQSLMNGTGGIHIHGSQNFDVANTNAGGDDLVITMRLDNAGTNFVGVTGTLNKLGAGTLLLNGGNTYTGGTTINGGTLAVDGSQVNNRLSNNHAVTVNNTGTFEIRGVNAIPGGAVNAVDVTVNTGGTLHVVTGGSAVIGAGGTSHAHLRNITLTGGTVSLSYSGGGSAYHDESFQLNGTLTVSGTAASVINTSTTVARSGIALNGGRTFTVADVTSSAAADLTVSAELENTDTSPADDGLTKEGAGTMLLNYINSYSGPTVVNAGTLQVATGASIAPASVVTVNNAGTIFSVNGTAGNVTVNSGATLSGDGTVGNVTLNTGSTLSPGNSPGGLDTGNVITSSGAIFNLEVNGTSAGSSYDQISTMGTVSLDGILVLTTGYAPAISDKVFVWLNDSTDLIGGAGQFTGLPEGSLIAAGADFWKISYKDNGDGGGVANDISLTYIPEPSFWALTAATVMTGLGLRRR